MRKSYFAAAAAALLIGMAPVAALAEPTLSLNTVTASSVATSVSGENVAVNVSCKAGDADADSWVAVDATTTQASNTPEGASVVASFEITE